MRNRRIVGATLIALGAAIASNAVLGPLVLGVIRIHESPAMETQLLGGELTSLFIAAPLAIAAGIAWWRGDRLAPFLAAGPSAYALYTYVQFVLVPDYSRYPGNNENYFFLYLSLVIAGWTMLLAACRAIAAGAPRIDTRLARTTGAAMLAVGSSFALAWVGSIVRLSNPPLPTEYLEHPTAFWLIRLMDLGFVIPASLTTGWLLVRGAESAGRWAYGFIGMQTLLTCAVAGMAIRMALRDDPAVTTPLLVVSTTGAGVFLVLYVLALRNAAA
ncbi:MAG TPA: hypothetical protein VGQ44_13310 [Gemmatimonadaceae bacterium]|jgi:hypothetical protein|nr:hypothetical protein [Gemmatimonadaceae bacterium]